MPLRTPYDVAAQPVLGPGADVDVAAPAANAAAIVTLAAAGLDQRRYIIGAYWSYSAAPTGGRLTISGLSGGTLDVDITAAGPNFLPFPEGGARGGANGVITVTLAAGGAGVTGRLNVFHRSM